MTSRSVDGTSYTLTYDAENRLNSVTQGGQTTTFTYDADGQRVVRDTVTKTIVYVGSHYEKQILLEDLNGDGAINVVDIMQVASRWRCRHGDDCYDAVASMIQTPPTPAVSSDRVRPCSPHRSSLFRHTMGYGVFVLSCLLYISHRPGKSKARERIMLGTSRVGEIGP